MNIQKTLFILLILLTTHTVYASAKLNIFACEPEWAALSKELAALWSAHSVRPMLNRTLIIFRLVLV